MIHRLLNILTLSACSLAFASAVAKPVGGLEYARSDGARLSVVDAVENYETLVFQAAILYLDGYFRAGARNDVRLGSEMMYAYYVNAERAVADTHRLYHERRHLLAHYRSVTSDIYGYEVSSSRFGPNIEIEGGVETDNGSRAEFSARMVYRDNKWLIVRLTID